MIKRKRLVFGSCEHCRKRLRGKSYGGRATRYCTSCAKAHDIEWYTIYIAATRCEQCQKKKRCAALHCAQGTSCCISCAKVYSPEWYAAYFIARHCEQCKKKFRSESLQDGHKTHCCVSCAKTHDPEWYAAYAACAGRLTGSTVLCEQCKKRKRCSALYSGHGTQCCISCAKVHDREWYTKYLAVTRCKQCNKRKRAVNFYDGRRTLCCITCAKTHDHEWYTSYMTATRCNQCRKNKRSVNYYGGRWTLCCISCAKKHDSEWHVFYMTAMRCKHCKEQYRNKTKYDGRKTSYCVSCASTHDQEWYCAYVSAMLCEQCKKQQRIVALFDGHATRYCKTCAKTHDPNWYAAYLASKRCKFNGTSSCGKYALAKYDGYCATCFTHLFPDDRRACFRRYKELAVSRFLSEHFPNLSWTFDKRIFGGCSLRRPDHFVHLGSHAITVETDEYEHASPAYSCLCEDRKMMEHFQDAHNVPHVFIRFNPDAYVTWEGKSVPGCWGRTPQTHEPRVAPRQREQWQRRLQKLKDTIDEFAHNPPLREVEIVQLFFSCAESHLQDGDLNTK